MRETIGNDPAYSPHLCGLTKRELFALEGAKAFINRCSNQLPFEKHAASYGIRFADILIEQLNKSKE